MSGPLRHCPTCRADLRPGASYCTQCGLEVRHPCPACLAERRFLANLEPATDAWCGACEALLHACERCGRWLLPDALRCPDPQCGGRVLPHLPQYTGRRWDGIGASADWRWRSHWERLHPGYRAPVTEYWRAADFVQAAVVAHGKLFLWQGTNLVAPDAEAGWGDRSGEASVPAWRSPLGPSGSPARSVPFEERVAIVGGCAILALEHCFLQVDLRHPGDVTPLPGGIPLAQVGGPGWWAGWTQDVDGPVLRLASAGAAGHLLDAEAVPVPLEALPGSRPRLVQSEGRMGWLARDGSAWELDCRKRAVRCVQAAAEGRWWLWAEADGLRSVRESLGQISVTLSAPEAGQAALVAPAGFAPFRAVFSGQGQVLVVGDRVVALDARTGDRLHEAVRPPGQWLDAVLVPAPDGEPRLLVLALDGCFASLSALRLSSGVQELLWRELDVEPSGLLPCGDTLYLAHRQGVVRFRDGAPGSTDNRKQ